MSPKSSQHSGGQGVAKAISEGPRMKMNLFLQQSVAMSLNAEVHITVRTKERRFVLPIACSLLKVKHNLAHTRKCTIQRGPTTKRGAFAQVSEQGELAEHAVSQRQLISPS